MQAPALVGAVLDGKYSIARMIGHGGMGAVYQAQHLGTGRPVAVKVLLSTLVGSNEAVVRFRREARAAGRLRHPNIVDVTDFGVARVGEQDVAYLIMEYLEGSTLRGLIEERGALPLEVVVGIVEQIAVAVEAAHRAGIIHRDLKPDNVWLVNDARGGFTVRVLDFGIAQLSGDARIEAAPAVPAIDPHAATIASGVGMAVPILEGAAGDGVSRGDATEVRPLSATAPATTDRLTVAGTTLGTPLYMSPEQCGGRDVDERSDIYSLGVMTYELLSGRRPFTGGFRELIEQHLHVPPPPLAGVPSRVATVVTRALAKDPKDRYASAQALAGSLRVAAEGPGTIVRRSIALYIERFDEFFRVSVRVTLPPVLVTLTLLAAAWLTGVVAGPRYGARVLIVASAAAPILWFVVTTMTNATFAAAVERLRVRPLERLDASQLEADVRTRVGLSPSAGYVATLRRVAFYYFRCELRSEAGAGDLAFLIGFLEGVPLAEIPPRCSLLAAGSRRAYTLVRAALFAALVLVPVVEAALIVFVSAPFAPASRVVAMLAALALLPVNAMIINPIFSSALALLYFRARQANGEDVPLSAVLPGRV